MKSVWRPYRILRPFCLTVWGTVWAPFATVWDPLHGICLAEFIRFPYGQPYGRRYGRHTVAIRFFYRENVFIGRDTFLALFRILMPTPYRYRIVPRIISAERV